jgi:Arc/MetJ-type ribon-helix-helix transcriptional regulator
VKLSVSLSGDDVALLDEYVRALGLSSRSAVVQHAIRLLRQQGLEQAYADAWTEWEASGEQSAWASVSADGLADAAR